MVADRRRFLHTVSRIAGLAGLAGLVRLGLSPFELRQAIAGFYLDYPESAANPALTYINSASYGFTTTTTTAVSITHGLTISSGDLIIACIHTNGGSCTFTDNNGGTPFTETNDGVANSSTRYLGWRITGGSEPSAYAWTLNVGTNRYAVCLLQFRPPGGYSVQNPPIDITPADPVATTDTNTTITATQITVTSNHSVLIGAAYIDGADTFSVEPLTGGTKEEANQGISLRYQLDVSAGATGGKTWTWGGSQNCAAELLSLKPAA